MKHQVNVSVQILPTSASKHAYNIIDKAIDIIKKSGIKHLVCPFETVMEGDYDKIMGIIRQVNYECLEYGADSIFSNIKIQIIKNSDVYIEDKIGKYIKNEG